MTLIETLVVIGVIAILLAILLPAVHRAREASRRAGCENNLRQIGLAIKTYSEMRHQLPEPAPRDAIGGWVLAVLPYMEEPILAEEFAANRTLDPASISMLAHARPEIFTCPSALDEIASSIANVPRSHYAFQVLGRRNDRHAEWLLLDVSRTSRAAWIESPESTQGPDDRAAGPHDDGYNEFYSRTSRVFFREARD